MTDVSITYVYDLPLCQRTWRMACSSIWRRPFGRFLKYVAAPLIILLGAAKAALWRDYAILAAASGYFFFTFVAREIYARFILPRKFRKMPMADKPISVRFTDEAVESSSPTGSCAYRWEVFRDMRETPRYFVFRFHNNLLWLAPKAAFASPEDMRAVRDLARRKVKQV